MKSLTIKMEEEKNNIVLYFDGDIIEGVEFPCIQDTRKDSIIFDLAQVTFINSCGVREWVNWISDMQSKFQIIFRCCPGFLIEQMNILFGFVPQSAIIESFEVPYSCEDCNQVINIMLRAGVDYTPATKDKKYKLNLPELPKCSECNKTMELDVLTNKYFKFLDPYNHK